MISKSNNIIKKFFKNLEDKYPMVQNYGETEKMVETLKECCSDKNVSILDVGCGYGRNIKAFASAGFKNVVGVDINLDIVKANRGQGLQCVHKDDLDNNAYYDVILMSHVIEHFNPNDLINFIDSYLNILKIGGFLIIVTPAPWYGFYQDFDHIKPYYPWGILSVFSGQKEQVQYYGQNKIKLYSIPWVRKMPFVIMPYKNSFLLPKSYLERIVQICLNVIFYMSKGKLGRHNGWIGVFQKENFAS